MTLKAGDYVHLDVKGTVIDDASGSFASIVLDDGDYVEIYGIPVAALTVIEKPIVWTDGDVIRDASVESEGRNAIIWIRQDGRWYYGLGYGTLSDANWNSYLSPERNVNGYYTVLYQAVK